MIEKVRNALLPPPAAIIGIVLLLVWVLPLSSPSSETIPFEIPERSADQNPDDKWQIGLPVATREDTDLRSIADNSLFLQRRAPWQNAPAVVVSAPAPPQPTEPEQQVVPIPEPLTPPKVSLLGIVSSDQALRALVYDETTNSELWLTRGEMIRDWQVVQIRSDDIILRAQGEEIVVTYNR